MKIRKKNENKKLIPPPPKSSYQYILLLNVEPTLPNKGSQTSKGLTVSNVSVKPFITLRKSIFIDRSRISHPGIEKPRNTFHRAAPFISLLQLYLIRCTNNNSPPSPFLASKTLEPIIHCTQQLRIKPYGVLRIFILLNSVIQNTTKKSRSTSFVSVAHHHPKSLLTRMTYYYIRISTRILCAWIFFYTIITIWGACITILPYFKLWTEQTIMK